jgi:hypothetical protein
LDKNNNLVRANENSLDWVYEKLNFSIYERGKWRKQQSAMLVASCLYASRGWQKDQAYILSIIKENNGVTH